MNEMNEWNECMNEWTNKCISLNIKKVFKSFPFLNLRCVKVKQSYRLTNFRSLQPHQTLSFSLIDLTVKQTQQASCVSQLSAKKPTQVIFKM